MPLNYVNLDTARRGFMVQEVEFDISMGPMNPSSWLSGSGLLEWPNLLLDAARHSDDGRLASQIRFKGLLNPTVPRRKGTGEITCKVPITAPETLAEGEFNRFYMRAICRRAIAASVPCVIVYRAKPVSKPRPDSERNIGRGLDPSVLLDATRATRSFETGVLGLLLGPNSGLSVKLP